MANVYLPEIGSVEFLVSIFQKEHQDGADYHEHHSFPRRGYFEKGKVDISQYSF